jgi:hypothetical protein
MTLIKFPKTSDTNVCVTVVIPIRMNAVEVENLDEILAGSGAENRSEFIRLLIHREFNRRRGISKPKASDYQTIFRIGGRPKMAIAVRPGKRANKRSKTSSGTLISPSSTRAASGVFRRTKIPCVTRRSGVQIKRAK